PPGYGRPPVVVYEEEEIVEPRARRRAAQPQRSNRGAPPPAGERRFVPNEVVIGVASTTPQAQVTSLLRRNRLTEVERQSLQLSGTTMMRLRIPDRRSVASVVRTIGADRIVVSAQPNYLFRLQQHA